VCVVDVVWRVACVVDVVCVELLFFFSMKKKGLEGKVFLTMMMSGQWR